MENSIKVSVLVTFYNQREYVDRTLSCILDQIMDFNMEIIAGDDGSSDGTLEKLRGWKEKYPDIIHIIEGERKKEGEISVFRASHNRIRLLQRVRGKYFIFLDGDDYFSDREKLKKQAAALDNENNRDCAACGHGFWMEFGDGSRKAFGKKQFPEGKYDAGQYWANMYCHTDTLLIRSSVIPGLNVDLLENLFDDNLITFSVIQYGKLYYIPENMAVYSQTGDGIWTSGNEINNRLTGMMCYDLSNKINPDLFEETSKRFSYIWFELFRIRKRISKENAMPYLEEAESKGLRCTKQWILYNELNFVQKIRLICSAPKPARIRILKHMLKN